MWLALVCDPVLLGATVPLRPVTVGVSQKNAPKISSSPNSPGFPFSHVLDQGRWTVGGLKVEVVVQRSSIYEWTEFSCCLCW